MSLKDRAKWAVDHLGGEVIVWASLGLLFFVVSFRAYPLVALLVCGGLFSVLIDFAARIQTGQSPR